jgi:nickel/cobalt exporter
VRRCGGGRLALLVCALAASTLAVWALNAHDMSAFAQAKHPFSVGAREAGGASDGIVGWILAKQADFHRQLSAGVRATRDNAAAVWALAGLAFAYGVFHAAGPGHGKAVIGAYMTANERALGRGAAIAFGAAALQGAIAFLIVAIGAALLGATSTQMTGVAQWIETASYAAIFGLGLWLSLRKAKALRAAWRGEASPICADCGRPAGAMRGLAYTPSAGASAQARAVAAPIAAQACAHPHMPDPKLLGDGFRWRETAATLIAAGARPCSGAIVVLVFALAQGVFWAGGLAVAAMSLGTAITTTALAAFAVLFKQAALALSRGGGEGRMWLALRGVELAAALALALLGAGLLTGALATPGGA